MPDTLPPALREALGPNEPATAADIATVGWRCRDRARAMAAALRWALTCREFWPEIHAAIAALEQEATDAT